MNIIFDKKPAFLQGVRFIITGASAFLIDLGIYYGSISLIGMTAAKAVSFIGATFFTFILNKYWTFQKNELNLVEIVKYISFYCISMVLNNLVNHFVYHITSIRLLSFMAATVACMVLNFIVLKWFIFKKN